MNGILQMNILWYVEEREAYLRMICGLSTDDLWVIYGASRANLRRIQRAPYKVGLIKVSSRLGSSGGDAGQKGAIDFDFTLKTTVF